MCSSTVLESRLLVISERSKPSGMENFVYTVVYIIHKLSFITWRVHRRFYLKKYEMVA